MNAEELFLRYFFPLYPPDARADLAQARALDANPGRNPCIVQHLDEAARRFVSNAGALFDVDPVARALDGTDASIHRLSVALTRERRDRWAALGGEGTPQNVLFNAVVHGAAYVGACIVAHHGGHWSVRRPLWESVVRLDSRAGRGDLTVFHWWLKALADDAQGTTLADRYRAHVEVPCARPEELPAFLASRADCGALPRLRSPRYDLLHRYLRAHLPEVRDLGEHFPEPERFEALGLKWLDFRVLGEGRMVLMAGASPSGLHLMWLTAAGFEKGAFFPSDAWPEPAFRVRDDRILVMTRDAGQEREQEMLWWGP